MVYTLSYIPLEQFVSEALYGENGYYSKHNRFSCDYITAPMVHSYFGKSIACEIVELYKNRSIFSSQKKLLIFELGAGNGILASDITEYIFSQFSDLAESLFYKAFDKCPPEKRFYDVNYLSELPSKQTGFVIMNELLDALPPIVFKCENRKWLKAYTESDASQLEFKFLPVPEGEIEQFENILPESLQDGFCELGLQYEEIVLQLGKLIANGIVLIFDYGYFGSILKAPTVRTFCKHFANNGKNNNIGTYDITHSVNFNIFCRFMYRNGFRLLKIVSQREFLLKHKIWEELSSIRASGAQDSREKVSAILKLIDQDLFGGYKVLLFEKNQSGYKY